LADEYLNDNIIRNIKKDSHIDILNLKIVKIPKTNPNFKT